MSDESRAAELSQLIAAMQSCWSPVAREIQRMKAEYVERLIVCNNEETRGRVKQLNDMLELPERLLDEAQRLNQDLSVSDS